MDTMEDSVDSGLSVTTHKMISILCCHPQDTHPTPKSPLLGKVIHKITFPGSKHTTLVNNDGKTALQYAVCYDINFHFNNIFRLKDFVVYQIIIDGLFFFFKLSKSSKLLNHHKRNRSHLIL